jgi:hypothetical protein
VACASGTPKVPAHFHRGCGFHTAHYSLNSDEKVKALDKGSDPALVRVWPLEFRTATRIAVKLVADQRPVPGARSMPLSATERIDFLAQTLAEWHSLAHSTRSISAPAEQLWTSALLHGWMERSCRIRQPKSRYSGRRRAKGELADRSAAGAGLEGRCRGYCDAPVALVEMAADHFSCHVCRAVVFSAAEPSPVLARR